MSPELEQAWKTFFDKVYNGGSYGRRDAIINQQPSLGAWRGRFDGKDGCEYDNAALRDMLEVMLASDGHGRAFNFDLVNICRQWLGNQCSDLNHRWRADYAAFAGTEEAAARDSLRADMKAVETQFLSIMDDIDALLEYEPYFLVGKWNADARAWGSSREEGDYFERNARNLITTWGYRGIDLTDYAERTVNGLVRDYYKPRWEMFFSSVSTALDDHGEYTADDYNVCLEQMKDLEASWWEDLPGLYRSTPRRGNPGRFVRKMLDKYSYCMNPAK